MARIRIAGVLAGTVLATSAVAAEKAPEPGTSVEMPYLIAPIVVDNKLTAYAYISSKIVATSPSAAIDIRAKTPFIQDAFVRDVNAIPVGAAAAPAKIDSEILAARLLKDTRRIMGSGKVVKVGITQIQVAQLRPNASP
jgi:hypothetical protein